MTNLVRFLLCLCVFSLVACSTLKINPPSDEKPTLLVLPFTIDNTSQSGRLGFHYIYEIFSVNGSVEPLKVVFKQRYDGDIVLIDSLPPGDYRLSKFSFVPAGTGNHTYGENMQSRNDRIRLEAGEVTVFPRSLNIRKYHKTPGRGRSITYEHSITAVTPAQSVQIIDTLQSQPNFDQWELQDRAPLVEIGLQGDWLLLWEPKKKFVTANGVRCYRSVSQITVSGSTLKGRGQHPLEGPYEIVGLVRKPGSIRGSFIRDGKEIGQFWGRSDEGSLQGKYVDERKCRGNWIFTRDMDIATEIERENRIALAEKNTVNEVSTATESVVDAETAATVGSVVAATATTKVESDVVQVTADVIPDGSQAVVGNAISGRYVSSITSDSHYIFKRPYRAVEITFKQQGNQITGVDDSGKLKIAGTIKGNVIKYYMVPSIITGYYNLTGEWTVSADKKQLTGYWKDSRGDGPGQWNLTRL